MLNNSDLLVLLHTLKDSFELFMKRVNRNESAFLEVISTSKSLKRLENELIFFHKTKNTDSNDNSNQLWRESKNLKNQILKCQAFNTTLNKENILGQTKSEKKII